MCKGANGCICKGANGCIAGGEGEGQRLYKEVNGCSAGRQWQQCKAFCPVSGVVVLQKEGMLSTGWFSCLAVLGINHFSCRLSS